MAKKKKKAAKKTATKKKAVKKKAAPKKKVTKKKVVKKKVVKKKVVKKKATKKQPAKKKAVKKKTKKKTATKKPKPVSKTKGAPENKARFQIESDKAIDDFLEEEKKPRDVSDLIEEIEATNIEPDFDDELEIDFY